jgi:hypothetical protein
MKRPQRFNAKYLTSREAAAQLRSLADHIEKVSDYAHWNTTVYIWRTAWEDPNFAGAAMTSASFLSKTEEDGD